MTFLTGLKIFLTGGFSFTAAIVTFEILKDYALGDKLKDFFLSEEAKLVAAAKRFEVAEKNLKAKLFGKRK
jgi:hypothetical protein